MIYVFIGPNGSGKTAALPEGGQDCPDAGLHPASVRALGHQMIRQDREGGDQYVVTHSPELLDALTEGWVHGVVEIDVWDRHGVRKRLARCDGITEMLAERWELGDLYRVGDPLIGGWPW